jgi:hypothetical protein
MILDWMANKYSPANNIFKWKTLKYSQSLSKSIDISHHTLFHFISFHFISPIHVVNHWRWNEMSTRIHSTLLQLSILKCGIDVTKSWL